MKHLILLPALILSASFPLSAQEEAPDSVYTDILNLDEIVVTATRVPRLLSESPVQTRLISSADIAGSDATDIEELLQTMMPGVEFSYAMNQQTHLNFGGFGGQSVLFLVDGERLAGETMDDVDFSRIDMSGVERIEILRGASSALYGSNAGGGVVNIITKAAARRFSANLDFRAGPHGSRRYVAGMTASGKRVSNLLSLSASREDSYGVKSAPDPAGRVFSTVYGHKTLSVKDKLTYSPLENLRLTGRAAFYMRQLPREVDAPDRYRSYSAGIKGEWAVSQADRIELSYSFDQYDKSQFRRLSGLDVRNYSNVQNSVRTLYTRHFSDSRSLTLGADYLRDYLLNTRLAESSVSQDNLDVFAELDAKIDSRWEIVATLRYDYFSDGRNSHLTPALSARFSPVRRVNLRASYGMGFRAPTLKEKYYEFDMAGIWIVRGNPDLKSEVSHNVNLSADYTDRRFNLTATLFNHYIVNRITTGLPYYEPGEDSQLFLNYVNLDNYHSWGGELSAKAAFDCGLSAQLSYAYTGQHVAKDRDGRDANNQYMPARPHSLTARIDWRRDFSRSYALSVGLNGRFLSAVANREYRDYYDLSQGTVKVIYPAYTLWKLTVVQTLWRRFRVSLALDNLFNYRPRYYYLNAPLTDGLSLLAGISIDL